MSDENKQKDFNSFVSKFIANAAEMDAYTAKVINDNYLELLAK